MGTMQSIESAFTGPALSNLQVRRVGNTVSKMGASPWWSNQEGALYWVDVSTVHRQAGSIHSLWQLRGRLLGSVVGVARRRDTAPLLLLALDLGFVLLDVSQPGAKFGEGAMKGRLALVGYPEEKTNRSALTRFGDGICDREGRFLAGTMVRRPENRTKKKAALYRLNADFSIDSLHSGMTVFDGACFSPDGRTLYFTDGGGTLYAAPYSEDGALGERRVLFDVEASPLPCSCSGGATVDRAGNVWCALPQGHCVVCISPSGNLLRHLKLPCQWPTSVAFGGRSLDVLFVTSSIPDEGDPSQAGGANGFLFAIVGLGATGIAEPAFRIQARALEKLSFEAVHEVERQSSPYASKRKQSAQQ